MTKLDRMSIIETASLMLPGGLTSMKHPPFVVTFAWDCAWHPTLRSHSRGVMGSTAEIAGCQCRGLPTHFLKFAEIIANPLLWHQFPGRYRTNFFFSYRRSSSGQSYIRPKSPRPDIGIPCSNILPYLPLALIRMN